MLRLERHRDADALGAAAGGFLVAREAEHSLILGILGGLAAPLETEAPYLASVSNEDGIVAVALRTPPWNLVLSEVDDRAALPLVIDDVTADLTARGPSASLRGVTGPTSEAATFADLWARRSGQAVRRATRERSFRLTHVRAPAPAPGVLRRAVPGDRRLLMDWLGAFEREALGGDSPVALEGFADRMLEGIGRAAYFWQDGEPVSLAGVGGRTPHGARIGPVYTPPERRGRGYASNLVAAVSRTQLDAGRRFLCLFTDLANPTANHIYQAIGYEPVRDIDEWRFEGVSQRGPASAPARGASESEP